MASKGAGTVTGAAGTLAGCTGAPWLDAPLSAERMPGVVTVAGAAVGPVGTFGAAGAGAAGVALD